MNMKRRLVKMYIKQTAFLGRIFMSFMNGSVEQNVRKLHIYVDMLIGVDLSIVNYQLFTVICWAFIEERKVMVCFWGLTQYFDLALIWDFEF